MKILVSDPLAPEALERLKAAQGVAVDVKTEMTPEELVGAIGEYDAIVVRSATKVTGDVVAAGKNLKVIGRAGIGLDNIDVKAAEKAGIKVVNTPAASSISVAELALAHMFALSRQIPKGTAGLKAGKWEKKALKGVELYNKTLGIIGTGRIGRELAKRAAALGMTVLGYDPYITQADLGDVQVKLVPLDELLEKSDFISLHLPKTEETTHLLGQREFAKMKKGVRIINCARGGTIDENALYDAIVGDQVAGAALDVFETEPPGEHKLMGLDQVIGTPHIGAATIEGQYRVGIEVVDRVLEGLGVQRA
ncbi:3-phosphoglycerate dehydrogenase [candidate division TA06 bacterium DG_24]|jgi:D-3-phosphoglycerate dehydrogenase|uniref:3-phosphoglycerate dehydrogenase n=3 Tax=Bacteria division TA06 TaxID=1156500 RepID=A0A0S8JQ91_UNCT6|nr:MAG: 3-phosphoglycerate dehydrogenase [candidate division TA06 bacterium DG_24]KPK71517.1 MAG: 3-phosphoglycerate dehydrogenase [candidate division TA06 bacterium SM23_40]KPL11634.1 MAG: 3-phosphoglycerate dehydrogenase [candidate division TA06 bacterium SM1_40]